MPPKHKNVSIREAQGGYIVQFYSDYPMPDGDTVAVFTDLDKAIDYVQNVLSGATSTPIAEITE